MKRREEAHEALDRKVVEATTVHLGHLGLVDADNFAVLEDLDEWYGYWTAMQLVDDPDV